MKCAHTVLPFITLVTSMNKFVLCDVLGILEIGRNGKQYLNNVHICLNFLQTIVQYNKCYSDTYYNHNNLNYQLHAFNFL